MAEFQIHNILFQAQMGTLGVPQYQHSRQAMPPGTQQQMFAQQKPFYSPQADWASQQQPLIQTGNTHTQGDCSTESLERMF